MTREHPTPEELDAIEQHQYGAYDVNLPAWYLTPEDAREALGKRYAEVDDESIAWNFGRILDDKLAEMERERGMKSNFHKPNHDVK